jgi:hypothetical protein
MYNNNEQIYDNALVIMCWRTTRHTRYVIEFISDWRQVDGTLWVLWFLPQIKRDRHDITEISLKVALNDITDTFTFRIHIFAYNTEKIKIK